jgi:predicted SnoaL-like aldol condensation-catalyzing enzyme
VRDPLCTPSPIRSCWFSCRCRTCANDVVPITSPPIITPRIIRFIVFFLSSEASSLLYLKARPAPGSFAPAWLKTRHHERISASSCHKIISMKLLLSTVALMAASAPLPAQLKSHMTPQEQANLNLVLDWWREGFASHHPEMVDKYFADEFIQHNPNLAGGKATIKKMVARRLPLEIPAKLPKSETPVLALSQGDIVTLVFDREAPDPKDPSTNYKYNGIDIFRVKNGKIVEHWDGAKKDPLPPQKKK